MRKFLILAVLVGAAVFAAVSLANAGSGSVVRAQVPGEAKTLDAHQAKALAAAKSSRLGLRYLFADITVAKGETNGGAIKCPKKWHPVSGLFTSDSDGIVAASDAPVSKRKWAVFVLNEANQDATVTIGAVCEKGLPITGQG